MPGSRPGSRRHQDRDAPKNNSEAAGTPERSQTTDPDRASRRALIAETEQATLRLCRDVLQRSGFVVDAADSGIGAVIAARNKVPDLILVGLQLRDVPGWEAIAWLRSNPLLRSRPIISLGTNGEDDIGPTSPGASLRKPFTEAALRAVIQKVMN